MFCRKIKRESREKRSRTHTQIHKRTRIHTGAAVIVAYACLVALTLECSVVGAGAVGAVVLPHVTRVMRSSKSGGRIKLCKCVCLHVSNFVHA